MYISVMLFLIEDFYVYFSDAFLIEDSYVYFSDAFLIEDLLQSFFFSRAIYTDSLSAAKVTLHMTRRFSYYLYNMILPVILLAILGTFSFILKDGSGYSLTILLSMSVVMTILTRHIPPISTETCILSKC